MSNPPTEDETETVANPKVGRYPIIRQIGKGGMGSVYLAWHPGLNVEVALKTILPEYAADPYFRQKFLEEGHKQATLQHANILTAHDSDEADGQLFLVTEYANGGTLQDQLATGSYDLATGLTCVRKIAEGLEAAHTREQAVAHLDLKPENILMVAGEPKIADFGVARLVVDGHLQVTRVAFNARYCAPEQLEGRPELASDIYSMGLILWEVIAGDEAVDRKADKVAIARSLPNAPTELADLIARCLSPDCERRPSATELVQRLRRLEQLGSQGSRLRTGVLVGLAATLGVAIALSTLPMSEWAQRVRHSLAPPDQQTIEFQLTPRSARVWRDGQSLRDGGTTLQRGEHSLAVTAPGYVGILVELSVPQFPNAPFEAVLIKKPDTIDLEFLAFEEQLGATTGSPEVWEIEWQDPTLSIVARLLESRASQASIESELGRLEHLAEAADSVAVSALYLLAAQGAASDVAARYDQLERAANAGDALSALLTSRRYGAAAAVADDAASIEHFDNRARSFLDKAAQLGMPETVATLAR